MFENFFYCVLACFWSQKTQQNKNSEFEPSASRRRVGVSAGILVAYNVLSDGEGMGKILPREVLI